MAWRRLGLYQKGMRAIADLMASLSQLSDGAVRGIRKTAEDPQRISVLDVISVVTGVDTNHASTYFTRLQEQFPEVALVAASRW